MTCGLRQGMIGEDEASGFICLRLIARCLYFKMPLFSGRRSAQHNTKPKPFVWTAKASDIWKGRVSHDDFFYIRFTIYDLL